MVATSTGAAVIDGKIRIAFTKGGHPRLQLVGASKNGNGLSSREDVWPIHLIRRGPDTDHTVAVEKLVSTGIACGS